MDHNSSSLSSFTREETNFLKVALAFVTVHHQLVASPKRPRTTTSSSPNTRLPLLPSRPTRQSTSNTSTSSNHHLSYQDEHVQYMIQMARKEIMNHHNQLQNGSNNAKWKSIVQHITQQLLQWGHTQTCQWMKTMTPVLFFPHTKIQQEDVILWNEIIAIHPTYMVPILLPIFISLFQQEHPTITNHHHDGYLWQLVELTLHQAPLSIVEETVQRWLQEPPLTDLTVYYLHHASSNGTHLLFKWAQDQLLQKLLHKLQQQQPE